MTHTIWQRIDVLFRFLVTGIKAFSFGMMLWYLFLTVSLCLGVAEVSRHMHEKLHAPFYFYQSGWALGLVYGGMFFLAAMLAARSRWSCCPALAAFTAYAIFVLVTLPNSPPSKSDYWIFLLPLLTAPVGGWLGEHVYRRSHR